MLNIVNYSAMNQGLIIEMVNGTMNGVDRSVWFLREKDAAGYPEELFEQIDARDLADIGGEFCYSIVDGVLQA
jgi:hypothetical protein